MAERADGQSDRPINYANEQNESNKSEEGTTTQSLSGLLCLLRCLNTSISDTINGPKKLLPLERQSILEDLSVASVKERALVRESIFANMPPAVIFYKRESRVPDFAVKKPPARYKSVFRWAHTNLCPNLMKRTLRTSHYELVDEEGDWRGYWGKHLHSTQYQTMNYWQKVNHYPGDFHLGRKDRLWIHLTRMMHQFDGFDIMPYTYILPRDMDDLKEYLQNGKRHVIVKPPASARGRGILIISKIEDLPTDVPMIAQHYIEKPLVMNGAKFDLRIYVYVSSLDPLKIYIYNDGLARFASVPYCAEHSFNNQYMHLTNFSINKFAEKNGITDGTPDLKWKLAKFWKYVSDQGRDPNELWDKIKDVAVRAVISCSEHIRKQQVIHSPFAHINREIFGMDILVDANYKPWILEMNISPSMQSATNEDVIVKAPLLADLLNMWKMEFVLESDEEMAELSYRTKPLDDHKTKMHLMKEADMFAFYNKTGKISPCILTDLTDADLRYLIDFEEEFNEKGGFEMIFPAPSTIARYLKCINPTYATLLLTAWTSLSTEEREKGIERLQNLAEEGAHLAMTNSNDETDAETESSDQSPDSVSV